MIKLMDNKIPKLLCPIFLFINVNLRDIMPFRYFSTKTCVVGTQKNRLHETVLLSTNSI